MLAQAGGLHLLDGAWYLRRTAGAAALLCNLVAFHSCALDSVAELSPAHVLARELAPPPAGLGDVLAFCDMTTSRCGRAVRVIDRLAEICARYGPGRPVITSIIRLRAS